MTYDAHKKSTPLALFGPFGLRLSLLAVFSVALMCVDARQHHLDHVRRVLSAAVYPIRFVVDAPVSAGRWLAENLQDQRQLLRENAALREQQQEMSLELQRMAALEAENARLRALMDSSARVPDRVLHGEIMAVDIDNRFRHRVVIDKGRRHGAFTGQALISAEGILGQIMRAEDLSSEAILISDPGHAIPVAVNRTGLLTIAYGTGDTDHLELPFLPQRSDVQVGDLLVSSGLGGSFPEGYPVARITQIEVQDDRQFALVRAAPTAQLKQTRQLLLVWSREHAAEPPTLVEGGERDGADADSSLTASALSPR